MLSDFKVKPYKSKRIDDYAKRMSTPRGDDKKVIDNVMVSVLKQLGYEWSEDTSSNYDPQVLYDSLARYSPRHSKFVDTNTPAWRRAINATFKVFAKPKHFDALAPLEEIDELYAALKPTKSSGLPAMCKKEDDFWYAVNRSEQVLMQTKAPSPCIAYKRTQLGGKTRLVWGYPFEMTILEARFARPLIEMFMFKNSPMAFGRSKFEIGARIASIDDSYGQTYGLDFSKFDSTIPRHLIKMAFNILGTWFTEEDKQRLGWSEIIKYFIYTPIVMPNKKLYRGKEHGVPSGSYFTQLIDSVVNVMLQFWLAEEHGYSLSWEDFLVLGDDVIISIPKEIELTDLADSLATFGMIMHPDKTKKEAHFLGATWRKGIPYRDTQELLKKMVYPENYREYPSKDYYDRKWLVYQMLLQYASSYANVISFLEQYFNTPNVGMIDESILFLDAYTKAKWDRKHEIGSSQFVGRESDKKHHSLGSRLMA